MLIYNIEFLFLCGPAHWAHWANPGFRFFGWVGLGPGRLALFGPGLAHWKACLGYLEISTVYFSNRPSTSLPDAGQARTHLGGTSYLNICLSIYLLWCNRSTCFSAELND